MLNAPAINRLAQRKRILSAESDLNRQLLRLEFDQVSSRVESAGLLARKYSGLWKLGLASAPILGLGLARKGRSWKKWIKFGLVGWQLFKLARPFLQAQPSSRVARPS